MVTTRRRTRPLADEVTSPVDAETSNVFKLNDELLLSVFDILHDASKAALLDATLVCKAWHALAQRVLDNSTGPLVIGPQQEKSNLELFSRLKYDEKFRGRMKHLSVSEWHLQEEDRLHDPKDFATPDPFQNNGYFHRSWTEDRRHRDPTWVQMQALAEALSAVCLATFSWSAMPSLPAPIGDALQAQENCDVSVQINDNAHDFLPLCYTPYVNARSIDNLTSLAFRLSTLEVIVPAAAKELLLDLGELVWHAPKLRNLSVDAIGRLWRKRRTPDTLKGSVFDDFYTVHGLKWLERPESVCADRFIQFRSISFCNICICGEAWPTTLEQVDWVPLNQLRLSCVSLLQYIVEKRQAVTGLELVLNSGRQCEYSTCSTVLPIQQAKDAVMRLVFLKELTLFNGTLAIDSELLGCIGHCIESLTLHERTDPSWRSSTRPLLQEQEIMSLGRSCPRLRHLGIDVPHADTPYYAYLDRIASHLPMLSSLRVFREIERKGSDRDDPPRSASTLQSVRQDFLHLRYVISTLIRFEVALTYMPPAHLDRDLKENAHGATRSQRRLVASMPSSSLSQPQAYCIEVERAQSYVKQGATGCKDWASVLDWATDLAMNAGNFHWEPLQPF